MAGEQSNNEPKGKEVDEIQTLIEWMEQQGRKETSKDLLQVAQYLEEMQIQLSVMTKELQEVKQQLAQFQQEKPRQEVVETIQEISSLQNMITNISEKISTGNEYLKNTVAQAITTLREKGKEEMNQVLQKGISKEKQGIGKEVNQEQRVSIQEKLSEKKEVVEQKKSAKRKEQTKEKIKGVEAKGKRQEVYLQEYLRMVQ